MLIAQPLPFPRYFFQSLQVTNIKLAISPQPKVSGEPVTVSQLGGYCLSLFIIINQSSINQRTDQSIDQSFLT